MTQCLPHAVSLLIQDNNDKAGDLLECFNQMGKRSDGTGQQYDMEFENRDTVSVEEYR